MGEAVGIDPFGCNSFGVIAGVCRDDLWLAKVRCRSGGFAEFGGELAKVQVLASVLNQAKGCCIPKSSGSAVAEQNLVAIGQRKHLCEPIS